LLVLRSQTASSLGRREDAVAYAREAVSRADAGESLLERSRALQALGLATPDPDEACALMAQGAELQRMLGDPMGEALQWGAAAYVQLSAGRYEQALALAERALALLDDQGDDRRSWAARGFRDQALVLLDRCDEVPRTGLPPGVEQATPYIYAQVLVALHDGETARAEGYLRDLHARLVEDGAEEAQPCRELLDILAGRRTTGSWYLARALLQGQRVRTQSSAG
jgi:tetratricopeptide (TPR) repeat protein